jgi:uncharacterized protein (DUF1499 family)
MKQTPTNTGNEDHSMDKQTSAWVRWPGYLAWVFLALLPIAILTVRSGNWQQGLLLYALACLLSVLTLAFLAVLSILPRFAAERGTIFKRMVPALPGTALLIVALQGQDVPPIHDITTDTQDPPRFETVPTLRDDKANTLDIDPEVIAQQETAYPDLAPIRSPRNYSDSYRLALETARELGWDIVRDDPTAGFIEAVATTAIMNFRDDVVIRLRTGDNGVVVDLRSASRVGVSDLGANAERIRAFRDSFQSRVAAG